MGASQFGRTHVAVDRMKEEQNMQTAMECFKTIKNTTKLKCCKVTRTLGVHVLQS
jgi:hypothetical protein